MNGSNRYLEEYARVAAIEWLDLSDDPVVPESFVRQSFDWYRNDLVLDSKTSQALYPIYRDKLQSEVVFYRSLRFDGMEVNT